MAKAPSREQQAPQCPEDKHGAKYDNDTPDNWLRGMGPKQACGKPGYDNSPKGKR